MSCEECHGVGVVIVPLGPVESVRQAGNDWIPLDELAIVRGCEMGCKLPEWLRVAFERVAA